MMIPAIRRRIGIGVIVDARIRQVGEQGREAGRICRNRSMGIRGGLSYVCGRISARVVGGI